MDDIGCLRPSLFIGVPRVFDRIYSRVMGQIREGSAIKRGLFNYAFKRKLHFLKEGHSVEKVRRVDVLHQLTPVYMIDRAVCIGVPALASSFFVRLAFSNTRFCTRRFFCFHAVYHYCCLFLLPQASPFFDKLVFSKVKQRLGGRCRLVVSGGAPLSPHVEEFLRVAMCCPVVQVRQWHMQDVAAWTRRLSFVQIAVQSRVRLLSPAVHQ